MEGVELGRSNFFNNYSFFGSVVDSSAWLVSVVDPNYSYRNRSKYGHNLQYYYDWWLSSTRVGYANFINLTPVTWISLCGNFVYV